MFSLINWGNSSHEIHSSDVFFGCLCIRRRVSYCRNTVWQSFCSQVVSYMLETDAIWDDEPNVITIKIREIADDSVEGHVEILFTDDGRIMTEVDGCNQFEIYSDQGEFITIRFRYEWIHSDPIQCRSQSSEQNSFCFCNRIQADQINCRLPTNPILTWFVYSITYSDSCIFQYIRRSENTFDWWSWVS